MQATRAKVKVLIESNENSERHSKLRFILARHAPQFQRRTAGGGDDSLLAVLADGLARRIAAAGPQNAYAWGAGRVFLFLSYPSSALPKVVFRKLLKGIIRGTGVCFTTCNSSPNF